VLFVTVLYLEQIEASARCDSTKVGSSVWLRRTEVKQNTRLRSERLSSVLLPVSCQIFRTRDSGFAGNLTKQRNQATDLVCARSSWMGPEAQGRFSYSTQYSSSTTCCSWVVGQREWQARRKQRCGTFCRGSKSGSF